MNEMVDQTRNGLIGLTMNGHCPSPENTCGEGTVRSIQRAPPYIEIVEQPTRIMRMRYENEHRPRSIDGFNSTPENRTYPEIRIVNYKGPAFILVSCVTKKKPYQTHPHKLVRKDIKNYSNRGIYIVKMNNENMTHTFQNLGILYVKKKDVIHSLTIREQCQVDPFRRGFSHKSTPGQIDLKAFRLCFQAFLPSPGTGKFDIVVPPEVSEPIYEIKALKELVITELSHASGSVRGGQKMILLCRKVDKSDIQVLFRDVDNGQPSVWQSTGEFTTTNVHEQVAIVFKTPPYHTTNIDNSVQVQILLRRRSDGKVSKPVPFLYTPDDSGLSYCKHKKPKVQDIVSYNRQGSFNKTTCGTLSGLLEQIVNNPGYHSPPPCDPQQGPSSAAPLPLLDTLVPRKWLNIHPVEGSSNNTTCGSSSGAVEHLVNNSGYHSPPPYDPQQCPSSMSPLPLFDTLAPRERLNIQPVQGSSNRATCGTSSRAPQHLVINDGYQLPSPCDPQQYPSSANSLPPLDIWAPPSSLTIQLIEAYPEYLQATSIVQGTSVNTSTSVPGNPSNGNIDQPMPITDIPEQRESAGSLERYLNSEGLESNSDCSYNPDELLPNL